MKKNLKAKTIKNMALALSVVITGSNMPISAFAEDNTVEYSELQEEVTSNFEDTEDTNEDFGLQEETIVTISQEESLTSSEYAKVTLDEGEQDNSKWTWIDDSDFSSLSSSNNTQVFADENGFVFQILDYDMATVALVGYDETYKDKYSSILDNSSSSTADSKININNTIKVNNKDLYLIQIGDGENPVFTEDIVNTYPNYEITINLYGTSTDVKIADNAFANSTLTNKLTISSTEQAPESFEIGESAFEGVDFTTAFNGSFNIYDNNLLTKLTVIGDNAFAGATFGSDFSLDTTNLDSLTSIGDNAFDGATFGSDFTLDTTNLTSLTSIGDNAFAGATFNGTVNTIKLGTSIISYSRMGTESSTLSGAIFADAIFNGDTNTITLGTEVTKVLPNIFNGITTGNNKTLTINLEGVVTEIGMGAFANLTEDTTVTFSNSTSINKIGSLGVSSGTVSGTPIKPSTSLSDTSTSRLLTLSTTSIIYGAFENCEAIISGLTFDTNGVEVGKNSFKNSKVGATTNEIKVKELTKGSFDGYQGPTNPTEGSVAINTVILDGSMTSIPENAFANINVTKTNVDNNARITLNEAEESNDLFTIKFSSIPSEIDTTSFTNSSLNIDLSEITDLTDESNTENLDNLLIALIGTNGDDNSSTYVNFIVNNDEGTTNYDYLISLIQTMSFDEGTVSVNDSEVKQVASIIINYGNTTNLNVETSSISDLVEQISLFIKTLESQDDASGYAVKNYTVKTTSEVEETEEENSQTSEGQTSGTTEGENGQNSESTTTEITTLTETTEVKTEDDGEDGEIVELKDLETYLISLATDGNSQLDITKLNGVEIEFNWGAIVTVVDEDNSTIDSLVVLDYNDLLTQFETFAKDGYTVKFYVTIDDSLVELTSDLISSYEDLSHLAGLEVIAVYEKKTTSNNSNNDDDSNDSNNDDSNDDGDDDSNNSTTSSSSGGGSSITSSNSSSSTESDDETTQSSTIEDSTTTTTTSKTLELDEVTLPSVNENKIVSFNDISNVSWAKESIEKLAKASIVNGLNSTTFNPQGNTKRADLTIMIVNLLGLSTSSTSSFDDVSSDKYYYGYVSTAQQYGIINGSNGSFRPEENISRQDTMVIIANVLKALCNDVNTSTTALSSFSDAGSISSYAQESVAILVNAGIINGSNGKINPKDSITRAEISVVISKLYDIIEDMIVSNESTDLEEEIDEITDELTTEDSEETDEITDELTEDSDETDEIDEITDESIEDSDEVTE